MTNRLTEETSPYLLQHAHNPVDWYPWGDEALTRAQTENKPILLSVGYSACHWCHVMAHESFEDPEIAGFMNQHFVNIKVDREERPDIDSAYMEAVQTMTGSGGWPLTVFLTPDRKPFFGGTYFPPEDRQGMPGFLRVLRTIDSAFRSRRNDVEQSARELVATVSKQADAASAKGPLTVDVLHKAYLTLQQGFDVRNGGFGAAPKFPQTMALEFLLRYFYRTKDKAAEDMVARTLERMAHGGIHDQLGGGFHRYSTDASWQVPHFEKMLYDNALLSQLYLHAYIVGHNPFYRSVAEETLNYVLREMTDRRGGFYSAQDADRASYSSSRHCHSATESRHFDVCSIMASPPAIPRLFFAIVMNFLAVC